MGGAGSSSAGHPTGENSGSAGDDSHPERRVHWLSLEAASVPLQIADWPFGPFGQVGDDSPRRGPRPQTARGPLARRWRHAGTRVSSTRPQQPGAGAREQPRARRPCRTPLRSLWTPLSSDCPAWWVPSCALSSGCGAGGWFATGSSGHRGTVGRPGRARLLAAVSAPGTTPGAAGTRPCAPPGARCAAPVARQATGGTRCVAGRVRLRHTSPPGCGVVDHSLTSPARCRGRESGDVPDSGAVTSHPVPRAAALPAADKARVIREPARDDKVAATVTSELLQRPRVALRAMRNDDVRFTVNRAQFDNSEESRERIHERVPAVRRIEHTIEYLDLVGSGHQYVATLGRLVPRLRDQEFTEDERETVRRSIAKVRGAADWLEAALDTGRLTLDEQLAQLLKGPEPGKSAAHPHPGRHPSPLLGIRQRLTGTTPHRPRLPPWPARRGLAPLPGRPRTHLGTGRPRDVVLRPGGGRRALPRRVAPNRDPQHPGPAPGRRPSCGRGSAVGRLIFPMARRGPTLVPARTHRVSAGGAWARSWPRPAVRAGWSREAGTQQRLSAAGRRSSRAGGQGRGRSRPRPG
ncbi:DUF6192 family protein [Streptomyces sp. NPDC000594]|uniref:DUF6192 family protein n=1 Tax=Streptomyces sp. NPDC000594 TaxID=3154261 RepID=UPI003323B24B